MVRSERRILLTGLLPIFAASLLLAQPDKKSGTKHPANPHESERKALDEVTSGVVGRLPGVAHGEIRPVRRVNYIDDYIFGKMKRDKIPHAPISSDEEFLRRLHLDLTGRIPEPEQVRAFLKNADPEKRNRLIDDLTSTTDFLAEIIRTRAGNDVHPGTPYLDRWTYFFCDLYKNTWGELLSGRNLFWDFINTGLLLNVPYNQLVTEMLTATSRSNWQSGPANFLVRYRVDDSNMFDVNHEDTIEDLAVSSTRYFLGINLECVSCHDGAGHLEKINSWLSQRKREDFWRQASFFGGIRINRRYGTGQEFSILEDTYRYDLKYPSVKRVNRSAAETAPAFLLTGEKPKPGENLRQAYARMLTSHPQFARASANLIWAELMSVGIVDPPLDFDMDRQDPRKLPSASWTVQPTHPELLEAMAKDFVAHNYDVHHVIRLIVKSSAYQLSSRFPGEWKADYASYFARHFARRLSAEQLYDAISQSTDVFEEFQVLGLGTDRERPHTMKYAVQARCPYDLPPKVRTLLSSFGQSNRVQSEKSLSASMMQAAILLNSKLIKERVQSDKGRLSKLLKAEPLKSNDEIVEELFLATLGRFPNAGEKRIAIDQITQYREAGAQDLLWALLNKTEFLFNH
jgi:hypothetical protein